MTDTIKGSKPRELWLVHDDDLHDFHGEGVPRVWCCHSEKQTKDFASFHVIEYDAYRRAVDGLKSYKTSMEYAYEDHCDRYYLNVKESIEQTLRDLGELDELDSQTY